MKLSNHQLEVMIKRVFEFWKRNNLVTFKPDEKTALLKALEVLKNEYETERQVEDQAKMMVQQLEKQNPDIEPHKMFLLIKKKLAKDKGLIL
jgi:hypothetical protein